MTDDDLDALRAEVDRQTGPARAKPLTALGQALAQRYWRVGSGSPAAAPHLDEAIRVLDEAYGYLEPGEYPRGIVASQLGWLFGIRHVAHGSSTDDRERGIALLDEALGFPQLPPMLRLLARVVLGQLLMSRVTRSMQSPDFMMRAMGSGLSAEEKASADRAVDCFREVVDAPAMSAELTSMAQVMLGLAETLQMLAGGIGGGLSGGVGGAGGLDLGRMMQAMANLQNLQQQAAAPSGRTGFGRLPNLFEFAADDLAALDPLKRPVTVIEGAVPPAPVTPPVRDAPPRPAEPAATFRDAFHGVAGGSGGLRELLDRPAARLDVDTVDRLVGLATSLLRADDAADTDHLLLAAALYLRSVVDPGGGWGEAARSDQLREVREELVAAADGIAAGSAGPVVVAHRLATLLAQPALLAEWFADVVKALRIVDADGLLYLVADHRLLLSAATGALAPAPSALPARLVVVGDGPLPDGPIVSWVRSGAQLVALAGRTRRPVGDDAVFVANPRGDRRGASMEALLLRRTFYPRSTGLGDTGENASAAGTPDEVRGRLDASLLHLGCGVTADGGLELAGPAVLERAEIEDGPPAATGGLAMLPPADGAAALADALLATRCTGVVRFRDAVPDDVAAIVYFLLHDRLVDAGDDPAEAVAAVRRWLADPGRTPPDLLPPWLTARAGEPDLATYRDAVVLHGV
jgi:hypothetical protein